MLTYFVTSSPPATPSSITRSSIQANAFLKDFKCPLLKKSRFQRTASASGHKMATSGIPKSFGHVSHFTGLVVNGCCIDWLSSQLPILHRGSDEFNASRFEVEGGEACREDTEEGREERPWHSEDRNDEVGFGRRWSSRALIFELEISKKDLESKNSFIKIFKSPKG